jgi:hypothetical protein
MNSLGIFATPSAKIPNEFIPREILHQINDAKDFCSGLRHVRRALVPPGYEPFPFRRETQESMTDQMCSVIATYMFRHRIEQLKIKGVDFTIHLYIPEDQHHRSDHGHLLKRIATATREGKNASIDMECFDPALQNLSTGIHSFRRKFISLFYSIFP